MVIRFLCPNGHKIHCPDDQAGRAAKCPSCGVRFRIPELSEIEDHGTEESDSDASQAQLSDSGEFPGVSSESADDDFGEDEIEFLCPNGHRLHGPSSLQGQPGQCPDCGSRFRVPSYDEVPDEGEETPEDQISVARSDRDEISLEDKELEDEELEDEELEVREIGSSSLAELFSRLWGEKRRGAIIELHSADGQTIVPEHFAEGLSTGTHGVFAVSDPDGTYTLTVLAWDSVVRVQLRRLKTLPG